MWILFGAIAMITGFVNLVLGLSGKKYQLWMLLSLSFTILYMLSWSDLVTGWVIRSDWSALEDVVLIENNRNQLLCAASIVVNAVPVIRDIYHEICEKIPYKR